MDTALTLKLYISGKTPYMRKVADNVRELVKKHFCNQCNFEVVDITEHPELAEEANIFVTPTLIRYAPLPVHRVIGSFKDFDKVVASLERSALPVPSAEV